MSTSESESAAALGAGTPLALCDAAGRVLAMGDGADGVLACADGAVVEQAALQLLRVAPADGVAGDADSDGHFVLALPRGGGFVGHNAAAGTFPAVELLDEAQVWAVVQQRDGGQRLALRLTGTPAGSPAAYLASTPDGGVAAVVAGAGDDGGNGNAPPAGCWWTPLPAPVAGTVTAAHALRALHGRKVALWGGADRGWVTMHPPKMWGGGEVKSRGVRLNQWEQCTLHVLDAATGAVALRSAFDRWLCASPDGGLVADKKEVGQWERWTLTQVDPARVTLHCVAHGRPMYACADGERMDARPSSPAGAGTRFLLFDAEQAFKRYYNGNPVFTPPEDARGAPLSPLKLAGIVVGALGSAALVAGGIAAAVLATQSAQARAQSADDARAAAAAAAAAAEVRQRDAQAAADAAAARQLAAEEAAQAATAAAQAEAEEAAAAARARSDAANAAAAQSAAAAAAAVAAARADAEAAVAAARAEAAAARAEAEAARRAKAESDARAAEEAARAAAAQAAADAARQAEAAATRQRDADAAAAAAAAAEHERRMAVLSSQLSDMAVNEAAYRQQAASAAASLQYANYNASYHSPAAAPAPAPVYRQTVSYTSYSSGGSAKCGARTQKGTPCQNPRGGCRWH